MKKRGFKANKRTGLVEGYIVSIKNKDVIPNERTVRIRVVFLRLSFFRNELI